MSKKITEFVKDLNAAFEEDGIEKQIKVNELHKWLKQKGFVDNKKDKNGETYRHVTKAGKEIGLKNESTDYGAKRVMFVRRSKDIIKGMMLDEK